MYLCALALYYLCHNSFQRTIRSLVIRAVLDWTDDFRHQDAEKMATLFRAVRTSAHSSTLF